MRFRRRESNPHTEPEAPLTADAVPQPAPDAVASNDLGAIDVERALRLVRMAAALIAMAAAIGARGQDGPGLHGPAAAGAILAGALAINLITAWTSRKGWKAVTAIGGQVLDVAGSLALVYLLDQALDGSAWMVMLLPIVMGGVRFGASGTLLAWTLGCSGYLGLVLIGVIDVPGKAAEEFGASLQRFAFLLALAVPVAALTQWMQQRWEHQHRLTVAASLRAQRLELIESLARSFIGSNEPKLLANLADAGLRLGFSTVTITLHSEARSITVAAVGESRALPTDDVSIRPEPGETLVTHWSEDEDGESLTSVTIMLDATGNAIAFHGWSPDPVDDDLARSFGLLGAHASVSLRAARLIADLEREAKQDALTGLLNRRAFDEQVDLRSASHINAALLILDVDHFKEINDSYGHPAGDQVLRVIGERLRAAATKIAQPGNSAVARIGGDEFAVLLVDTPLEVVADVADRIESSMMEPVALGTTAIPVTFSIGIADAAAPWAPRELIAAADEATYQAKTHGRNRTCWAAGPVGSSEAGSSSHQADPPEAPAPPVAAATTASARPTDLLASIRPRPEDNPIRPPQGRSDHSPVDADDPLITLFERSMDTTAPSAPPTPPRRPHP